MLCAPALRLLVQVAVLVLALPVGSATAPQPVSVVPSAVKATFPVGALPFTVAVKVTLAPTNDGVPELASDVLVAVLPAMATETVNRPEGPGVALMTLMDTP